MNRNERDRLIASLTENELSILRNRVSGAAAAPPEDNEAERQFVRELLTERDPDWLSDVLDRIGASPQPVVRRGNQVPTEGGNPGRRGPISASDYTRDFLRQLNDPTYGGNDLPPETP